MMGFIAAAAVEVSPGYLKILDVALLDLVERGEPGCVRAPAVILPRFVILRDGNGATRTRSRIQKRSRAAFFSLMTS
jgi:hypothetical protein